MVRLRLRGILPAAHWILLVSIPVDQFQELLRPLLVGIDAAYGVGLAIG